MSWPILSYGMRDQGFEYQFEIIIPARADEEDDSFEILLKHISKMFGRRGRDWILTPSIIRYDTYIIGIKNDPQTTPEEIITEFKLRFL